MWEKQHIAKDTWCNYHTHVYNWHLYKLQGLINWFFLGVSNPQLHPDWKGEGGGTQQTCIEGGFVPRSNPNPLPFEIPFWTENEALLYTQLRTLHTIFKIWINYHKTGLLSQPFHIPQNASGNPFGPFLSLDWNDRFPYFFIYFSWWDPHLFT